MKPRASFEKQLNVGEKRRIAECLGKFQLMLAKKSLPKSLNNWVLLTKQCRYS